MVRRAGLIILAVTLFYAISAEGRISIDAPHNISNGIDCESCHGIGLLSSDYWDVESPTYPVDNDRTLYNLICMSCHTKPFGPYTPAEGPFVATHSAQETESTYHDPDKWTNQCINCHNPHIQEQKNWVSAADRDQLELAKGSITNFTYDSATDTSILTFDLTDPYFGITYKTGWNADRLSAKTNEYARTIIYPNRSNLRESFMVLNVVDDGAAPFNTITIKGDATRVWRGDSTPNTEFYILYGQLIRQQVNGLDVKFFDNTGTNSFADGDAIHNGICEVCHALTVHYKSDGTGADHTKLDRVETITTDGANCMECHRHTVGFAHKLDGTGDKCKECHYSDRHSRHMDLNVKCSACHNLENMWSAPSVVNDPTDNLAVCEVCHQDGRNGLANDTDYSLKWNITDYPTYDLLCDGCHNGRPDTWRAPEDLTVDGDFWDSPDTDNASATTLVDFLDVTPQDVMSTDGHNRLVGLNGVRQYPCWFCHADSISGYIDSYDPTTKLDARWDGWTMTSDHCDGEVDVVIPAKWYITGAPVPFYDNIELSPTYKNCMNTYCHSDGTGSSTDFRAYPWDDTTAKTNCDSCHGHPITQTCSDPDPAVGCHPTEPEKAWTDETVWLSAMPMYKSEGPGAHRANSHFMHLLQGLACDDCHAATVTGGLCLTCHDEGIPAGSMSADELSHINSRSHVDKVRTVAFKNGGDYYPTQQGIHEKKSCDGTICHVGADPQWGGSGGASDISCIECHGNGDIDPENSDDIDSFGAFDGTLAKIDQIEWVNSGHGRPALDVGGDPNPYDSGNPAADFPSNGCWYCHDNDVLHQNETNPFRLRKHEHFYQRFDRECAYCHMMESDDDCLLCHNDPLEETLAPQLETFPEEVGTMNPLYKTTTAGIARADHGQYLIDGKIDGKSSCAFQDANFSCHIDTETRHKVEVPTAISNSDEIANMKNAYVLMGVCLKCHDDDSGGQCLACHTPAEGDPANKYDPGFDPEMGSLVFIKPQQAKAASFHFGYKHYASYLDSLDNVLYTATTDDPPFLTSKLRDMGQGWADDVFKNQYVVITSGANDTKKRRIKTNTSDTITLYSPFSNTVDAGVTFNIVDAADLLLDTGTVDEPPVSAIQLKDEHLDGGGGDVDDAAWVADQWLDLYDSFEVMMTSGVNNGVKRKITSHTADTITFVQPFPNNIVAGETYKIVNPIWKGGKFCWDCHDPHGDSNYLSETPNDKYNWYMIQAEVATETDGEFGKPIPSLRKSVKFINNIGGSDYAKVDEPYDGICNVCHTDMYYDKDSGGNHNLRKCTLCHEHRFTDSHANKKDCHTCHGADVKPAPRHTAFGLPRDCTKCHEGIIKKRMDIMEQFRANSHHVQNDDGSVTNKHCYACHWEATSVGLIDVDHHTGYNYKTHVGFQNDPVDLVIWGQNTTRPTEYTTTPGTATAVTFRATQLLVSLPAERAEIAKITPHCLGCHNDANNETIPFDDCKTPRQYSWDGYSIDAKYSDTTTTTWGKYTTTAKAAKKNLVKAYSAHGNAVSNEGGFDDVTGVEETIVSTRAGANYNVECFDCHSSHGSMVNGVSSSYVTFNGTNNGANLKETINQTGGYDNSSYAATAYTNPSAVSPYNAGAGQCFDCHETHTGGPAEGNGPPWGYNSTFGASMPIIGYKDNERFVGGYMGILESGISESPNTGSPAANKNVSLAYRSTIGTMGGHLNASHNNPLSPFQDPSSPAYAGPDPSVRDVPTRGSINGLCSPCHDPHGVSPSIGTNNMKYAVPLLKGTWLTSPYRDDHPPPPAWGGWDYAGLNDRWGNNSRVPNYLVEYRYNIDRILFNDIPQNNTFITETDQQFAGLCLRCHPKENLTNDLIDDQDFRSVDRIHETVKGWGGNDNEHYFPCSKCHKPHTSGLPRLMTTNCLDFNHRGGVAGGGLPYYRTASGVYEYSSGKHSDRGFPIAELFGNALNGHGYATECHQKVDVGQQPANATDWKTRQLWNDVTLW